MGLALDLLPAGGIAGPWHLIFNDEFNGAALDLTKWSPGWFPSTAYSGPIDTTYGLDVAATSQLSVSNGSLSIEAILEANTSPQGTFPYTSGAITTLSDAYPWTPLFSLTYGYVEARIWLPANGSAVADWPAFWMYSVALTHTYPNGEIDIAEAQGGNVQAALISSLGSQVHAASGTFAGGWHTFGVDWEPNAVTYYYDGVSVVSFTTEIPSLPMFIILDLEVSTALCPPAIAPATLLVDYVRVWQH